MGRTDIPGALNDAINNIEPLEYENMLSSAIERHNLPEIVAIRRLMAKEKEQESPGFDQKNVINILEDMEKQAQALPPRHRLAGIVALRATQAKHQGK